MKANKKRKSKSPTAQEVSEQATPKTAPTISKDQRIAVLKQCQKKIVDLIEGFEMKALPVLLFLSEVLDSEHRPDELVVRTPFGNSTYCHADDAVGEICNWLSAELYQCWNKVDEYRMWASGPNAKLED